MADRIFDPAFLPAAIRPAHAAAAR